MRNSSVFSRGVEGKLPIFIALLFFRVALDFSYVKFVSPFYSDHIILPMELHFDWFRYVLSLGLYAVSILSIEGRIRTVSSFALLIMAIFILAPLTSQYGLDAQKATLPVVSTLGSFLIISTITKVMGRRGVRLPRLKDGAAFATAMSWAGVIYLLIWSVLSGAYLHLNFNPDLIYEFREQAASDLDGGVLSYINVWVHKFFSIYLIIEAFRRKKYVLLAALIVIQFYFYGITSHRSVAALPLLAIIVYFFIHRSGSARSLVWTLSLAIAAATLVFTIFDYDFIASIFVRRTFYVPSGLTFVWFDFFSNNPFILWADKFSFIDLNAQYVDAGSVPRIIGDYLRGGYEINANNGMVSAGYAHAGVFGVFIYSIFFALFLVVFDSVTKNLQDIAIACALVAGGIRTALADSDLLTAFLSHGLLLSLLILWMRQSTTKTESLVTSTRLESR